MYDDSLPEVTINDDSTFDSKESSSSKKDSKSKNFLGKKIM